MEIALIRSGWMPDAKSDVGMHRFTYSIYPHAKSPVDADIVKEGYLLNVPALITRGVAIPDINGTISPHENGHVMISTVKEARNKSGITIRVFEYGGIAGEFKISFHREITNAWAANLLEEPTEEAISYSSRLLQLTMAPFEIKTIHIEF